MVDFFCDVLGCQELCQLGTFKVEEGDWMIEHLNTHPRAEITNMRMIRCGHGSNIGLFEYASPDKRQELPRNSDNGSRHFFVSMSMICRKRLPI